MNTDSLEDALLLASERIVQLESERDAIAKALEGIFSYACIGASVSDVNTYEQPQFIAARAALAKVQQA